ncbi:MAG: endonuclease III [Nitrospiraceae bacterium]
MTPRINRLPDTPDRPSRITAILHRTMPVAEVELTHRSPWELLVATILSAQCTDQRVNQVTPALFKRYRSPLEFAQAKPAELESLIKSTGFYKNKAKSLMGCGRAIAERFNGRVPSTMEELTSIPGVGRKTANVIMGMAFNKPAVVVDTHVKRVANRLGLTRSDNPERIESDLQRTFPQEQWTEVSQRLLLHGRYVCLARTPKCGSCALNKLCRWKGKQRR